MNNKLNITILDGAIHIDTLCPKCDSSLNISKESWVENNELLVLLWYCSNCKWTGSTHLYVRKKNKILKDYYGKFVTAQLKGKDECRQGWVISTNPLILEGKYGKYECEGIPVIVENPPKRF